MRITPSAGESDSGYVPIVLVIWTLLSEYLGCGDVLIGANSKNAVQFDNDTGTDLISNAAVSENKHLLQPIPNDILMHVALVPGKENSRHWDEQLIPQPLYTHLSLAKVPKSTMEKSIALPSNHLAAQSPLKYLLLKEKIRDDSNLDNNIWLLNTNNFVEYQIPEWKIETEYFDNSTKKDLETVQQLFDSSEDKQTTVPAKFYDARLKKQPTENPSTEKKFQKLTEFEKSRTSNIFQKEEMSKQVVTGNSYVSAKLETPLAHIKKETFPSPLTNNNQNDRFPRNQRKPYTFNSFHLKKLKQEKDFLSKRWINGSTSDKNSIWNNANSRGYKTVINHIYKNGERAISYSSVSYENY
ncbi:hypothetical protein FQA39_LY17110 [Lamprigera yunnana]|nr:hypothetical protein FQA39_LY17110 [Lamprigera yunnana]